MIVRPYAFRIHRRASLLLLVALLASPRDDAQAFVYTWSGLGATDNWSNANNWEGISTPVSDEFTTAIIFEGFTTRAHSDVGLLWRVKNISFHDEPVVNTHQGYTIGGNRLLMRGDISNLTSSTQTFDVAIELTANHHLWLASDGDLVFNGPRSGPADASLTLGGDAGHAITLAGRGTSYLGDIDVRGFVTVRLGDGQHNAVSTSSNISLDTDSFLVLRGFDEDIGSLSGDGTLLLGGATLEAGVNGRSTAFNGRLVGPGGFVKNGAGTLSLAGNHSAYSGRYEVAQGVLVASGIGDTLADHAALTVAAGASLRIEGDGERIGSLAGDGSVELAADLGVGLDNTSTAFGGAITGADNFTKLGQGRLRLTGVNTFTGAVNVEAGTLELAEGDNLTDAHAVNVAANGSLRITGDDESLGSLAGSGVLELDNQSVTIGANDLDTVFNGKIIGAGNVFKSGLGSWSLGGRSSYTGKLAIDAGILRLTSADALPEDTAVSVREHGQLVIGAAGARLGSLAGEGGVESAGELQIGANHFDTHFSGQLHSARDIVKRGNGRLSIEAGGRWAGDGQLHINAGALEVLDDGALRVRAPTINAAPGAAPPGATLALRGAHARLDVADMLIVGDSERGELTLHAGAQGQAGRVRVGNSTAGKGTLLLDGPGSQLQVDSSLVVGVGGVGQVAVQNEARLELGGELTLGARGALALAGGSVGAASLGMTGGVLDLSGGRLAIAGAANLGANSALNLSGGTLDVASLTLAGGAFNFSGGILQASTLRGAIVNQGGTLAPGHSAGVTHIIGDYQQLEDATLAIELGANGQHDQLQVDGGRAVLKGRLVISLLDGFEPLAGASFDIVSAEEGIVLNFAMLVAPSLAGRQFTLEMPSSNLLRLTVKAAASTSPVPAPPALVLLVSALAVVGASRRRRADHTTPLVVTQRGD